MNKIPKYQFDIIINPSSLLSHHLTQRRSLRLKKKKKKKKKKKAQLRNLLLILNVSISTNADILTFSEQD